MLRIARVVTLLLAAFALVPLGARSLPAQDSARGPVRLVIARLTHGHVGWILGRADRGDVRVVGIYEPDTAVVSRYARRYGFDRRLVYAVLGSVLDAAKPDADVAFGKYS